MATLASQALAEAIGECAGLLAADALDRAPLRSLQRQLQPVLKEKSDTCARTLAFFLDTWIDDFYFNLAGDVPSTVSEDFDNLRTALLRDHVAVALTRMGTTLRQGPTVPELLFILGDIISAYLDTVEEAEKLTASHHDL